MNVIEWAAARRLLAAFRISIALGSSTGSALAAGCFFAAAFAFEACGTCGAGCAFTLAASTRLSWVDVYNPALSFEKDSMLLDTFPFVAMGYCSDPNSGPFLRALDLNNDGYNELVVSHENPGGVDYGYGLWLGWTAGETYVFHTAPETLWQSWPIHLTDAFDLGTVSGHHAIAAYSWSIACGEGVGTDHSYVTRELRVLTGLGVTTRLVPLGRSYERCWEFDANFACVGNFGPGSFGQALLASTRSSVQSDCYFNPTVPIVSSTLELRALVTPDSTTLLWSRDITGTNYTNFMYHPQLPGVFFGFSGDTLLMFSGSDGSIRDRLTDVPSCTRYWDFPYNDSIPRLVVINGATVSLYHLDIATGANDENRTGSIPTSISLGNPYPNPFNPSTTIKFSMPKRGEVTVTIYNILGQPVRALAHGVLSAGEHSITWDGNNDAGREVSSGVYFVRASTTETTQTRKLMLLK